MSFFKSILVTCFLGTSLSLRGTVIYSADFSSDGVGYSHTTSSPPPDAPSTVDGANWTIGYDVTPSSDSSANTFITSGGSLVSDDFGGEAYFETDDIDLTGYTSFSISAIAETIGNSVFNNLPTEHFTWTYLLDDVVQNGDTLSFTSDGSLNYSIAEAAVSAASTLKVRFTFNINGSGDGFDISSIVVDGTTAVPEPSSAALLLGLGAATLFGMRRRKAA